MSSAPGGRGSSSRSNNPLSKGRAASRPGFRDPPTVCGAASQNVPLPPGPQGLGTQLPGSSTKASPSQDPRCLCFPTGLWLGVSRLPAEPWTKHVSPKTAITLSGRMSSGRSPCPHCQRSPGAASPPPSVLDQAQCYQTSKPLPSPAHGLSSGVTVLLYMQLAGDSESLAQGDHQGTSLGELLSLRPGSVGPSRRRAAPQ